MADIFIVEDYRHIDGLIKKSLQLVGHVCTQCFDGTEALKVGCRTNI